MARHRLSDLAGAPIEALAASQQALADQSWQGLRRGLEPTSDEAFRAKTRTFDVPRSRQGPGGERSQETLRVTVPDAVLTPCRTLAIESATVDLAVAVDGTAEKSNAESKPNGDAAFELEGTPCPERGRRRESDRRPALELHVELRARPPSEGLQRILDRLTEAIAVRDFPDES